MCRSFSLYRYLAARAPCIPGWQPGGGQSPAPCPSGRPAIPFPRAGGSSGPGTPHPRVMLVSLEPRSPDVHGLAVDLLVKVLGKSRQGRCEWPQEGAQATAPQAPTLCSGSRCCRDHPHAGTGLPSAAGGCVVPPQQAPPGTLGLRRVHPVSAVPGAPQPWRGRGGPG